MLTRRKLIHKWSVYGLGLVLVWLLDGCILPRYPLFGTIPMLLPLAATAVAVLEGAYGGAGFGMAVGLVWELAYPGGFGGLVFGMAAAGLAAGSASQYILSQSYPGCLICSCGVLLGLEALRLFRGVVTDTAAFGAMLPVAGAELALSLAWSPVIYLLFRSIYRRVGGTRLA